MYRVNGFVFVKETLVAIPNLQVVLYDLDAGQVQPDSIIEYEITCTSGWNVAGIFTVDPDGVGTITTGQLLAWSASFEEHDWIEQMNEATPFDTWLCSVANGVNANFLTSFPNKDVQLLDVGWTYFLSETPSDIDRARIETFDSSGVSISVFEISGPTVAGIPIDHLTRMASAPASLKTL